MPLELYAQKSCFTHHNGVVHGSSYLCFPGWWLHHDVENILTMFEILESELKSTWKVEFTARILDATLSHNLVACLTQKETSLGQVIWIMESKTGRCLTRIEDDILNEKAPVQKMYLTKYGLLLIQSLGRIIVYSSSGDKLAVHDLKDSLDIAPFLMNGDQDILLFPSLNTPERYILLDIRTRRKYQVNLTKEDLETDDIFIFRNGTLADVSRISVNF
jgi:hypothetical protein